MVQGTSLTRWPWLNLMDGSAGKLSTLELIATQMRYINQNNKSNQTVIIGFAEVCSKVCSCWLLSMKSMLLTTKSMVQCNSDWNTFAGKLPRPALFHTESWTVCKWEKSEAIEATENFLLPTNPKCRIMHQWKHLCFTLKKWNSLAPLKTQ